MVNVLSRRYNTLVQVSNAHNSTTGSLLDTALFKKAKPPPCTSNMVSKFVLPLSATVPNKVTSTKVLE